MADFGTAGAIKCFAEAKNLIDARLDPVKFNLFSGLIGLLQAVQSLEEQVAALRRELESRKQ